MTATRTVRTIDELKALVGEELGVGPWTEVTQERVNSFAEVTGDHQYIHVDPERAAGTPFGGTIAHGFLTLSLLPHLARDREGVQLEIPRKMGVNYGLNKVRFPAPVKVGKRIRLRSRLQSVDQVEPGVYQLVYEQTVEVEGEKKPGMVAESISRMYV